MDVDIDLQTRFKPEEHFDIIYASMYKNSELKKHPVGVYFQKIAKDNITNLSAIPYKEAEGFGYLKIDFLHLHVYDHFESNEQIEALTQIEPDWTLLESEENVKKLLQIHKQFSLVSKIKPKSLEDLADCLAIMRPGKIRLLDEYLKNPTKIKQILYIKEYGYTFKRSHAIAYAMVIVLQLHLIKAGII